MGRVKKPAKNVKSLPLDYEDHACCALAPERVLRVLKRRPGTILLHATEVLLMPPAIL